MIFLLSWHTILVVLGIFFAMLSVCMSHDSLREVHDYHYFYTHPVERARVMQWCRADARNASSIECRNALHVDAYPNVAR